MKGVSSWSRRNVEARVAAINLRTSGMSERDIYRQYKTLLKDAPNRRELHYSLRRYTKSKGLVERRKENRRLEFVNIAHTNRYRVESRRVRNPPVDLKELSRRKYQHTERQRQRLLRNYTVGYLARTDISPDKIADEHFAQYLETGEGSP
jgi:hypothetical protein